MFAINLHWGHWRRATETWGLTAEDIGPKRTWVWLTRRDLLLQAVSMSIAIQTDSWQATKKSKKPAVYDADHIALWLSNFAAANRSWATWFDRNEISPILAPYEDVVVDLAGHVERVLDAIDIKIESVPLPALKQQTTTRNAEWAEKFLVDRPEFIERRYDSSF